MAGAVLAGAAAGFCVAQAIFDKADAPPSCPTFLISGFSTQRNAASAATCRIIIQTCFRHDLHDNKHIPTENVNTSFSSETFSIGQR
ncbi:hypothetical protein [Ancylobacter defluvii]|uniref:hypothetical protein n=1 Tax=Ancylobacter defluvii TaxID=1282440 RepID=UPI001BCB2238|nr:hypothetical protein [Ancylobacter defluvii]MBS7587778.1 hypothetical protein [Ancylobacter defluvii]